ncbi:uncharacterized protein L3040_000023 [Drepanopeziza brunnea f. sp. 'multigermtubi']|uniref:uncharacterized protein n=1 Tax=Drepanopeziza brunnea f. sp. 'multigermtubi' TaxID=698441 RepID=UPI00238BA90A|nr:hypothetical protein L3040_000023 [Drepanopeziza brunnea f. sp. 'multigermtubi']
MSSVARRHRTAQAEESSEEEAPRNTQRRRTQADSEDEEEDEAEEPVEDTMELDSDEGHRQVVKKLVRYALACEFQRKYIRKADIMEKVIGKQQRGGAFKRIFDAAQKDLRLKFGMEMVQMTSKEKITMKEKRAASKAKATSKAPDSYILTTILPSEYRIPDIMPASNIESEEKEASYIGICTTIVSLIALSPNDCLPDHKLLSYLQRLNLDVNTGFGKTEVLLAKMAKDGYIYRTIEKTVDEEQIDWRVAARGKAEIGNNGIQGLVREVYGEEAPTDLDKKLQRSLGMEVKKLDENRDNGIEEEQPQEEEEEEEEENEAPDPRPSRRRSER